MMTFLLLADERVDTEKMGWNKLHTAFALGHVDVCGTLFRLAEDGYVDLNQQTESGITPLFIACSLGFKAIAEMLLAHRFIKPNLENRCGETCFHVACYNGHAEIAKLLLENARINPILGDQHGYTPLSFACEHDEVEIVKLLPSDPRVDVNQPSENGCTPFYGACQNGTLRWSNSFLMIKRWM